MSDASPPQVSTTADRWSSSRFKIGLFGYLHSGGNAFSSAPERWGAQWPDIVRMAVLADTANLDFLLPVARWSGVRSDVDNRLHSFETLTQAAALACITRQITLFSTVHAPLIHPVVAAKAMTTVDHASQGRAAINIVCGWNEDDFGMFGLTPQPHEARYAHGQEWFEIWSKLVAGAPERFDYDGVYFSGLKGLQAMPGSIRRPRPTVLSAAFSSTGRDFAVRTSDLLLTPLVSIEDGQRDVADFAARSARLGRPDSPGVLTVAYVVCRETREEAEAFHTHYADHCADRGAIDDWLRSRRRTALLPEALYQEQLRMAGGNGAFPLIGTPEDVLAGLLAIEAAGFAGVGLSFFNFADELPFFLQRVLPLWTAAHNQAASAESGLRKSAKRFSARNPL